MLSSFAFESFLTSSADFLFSIKSKRLLTRLPEREFHASVFSLDRMLNNARTAVIAAAKMATGRFPLLKNVIAKIPERKLPILAKCLMMPKMSACLDTSSEMRGSERIKDCSVTLPVKMKSSGCLGYLSVEWAHMSNVSISHFHCLLRNVSFPCFVGMIFVAYRFDEKGMICCL